MCVSVRTVSAAVALAAAVAVYVVRRDRELRRRLARERAASRLTEGCLHRDLAEFRRRVQVATVHQAVVREADLVLEAALAAHAAPSVAPIDPIDPTTEGGPV